MRCLLAAIVCSTLIACSSVPHCNTHPQSRWADHTQISADITQLASNDFAGRDTGSEGAALTRRYLIDRFQQIGLTPWQGDYQHPFSYSVSFSDKVGINIAGVVLAQTPTKQWRIVLAHYDHLGSKGSRIYHGADDNASGVSGLLQLAQHAVTQASDINLLFVATDAEEPGLYGAYALVDKFTEVNTQPRISQIELAINLDMIGRPDRRHAIYIEGARRFDSFKLMQQSITQSNQLCVKTRQPRSFDGSVISVDFLRASDHYPLHKAKIPWLYFGVPTHKDYHQPSDTADKIDISFVAAVAESAYQLLIIDSLLLQNSP
ncbi:MULTISPECIES: M28 family peptidase [unclassified Shewanella]|uniref:M28 family peptidase n=1 Tax=unclassified Shewanella TaxID=196818 RepID=UPI000C7B290E|nr:MULTISPECIES: M28 family peptidase [unclassified Shewanella]PKG57934.1 peptidase M28 [Shewanella sp. GutDb-MelDb]PKG73570.1 peptidase M28 [Shewanella sp. GutCb]